MANMPLEHLGSVGVALISATLIQCRLPM